MEQPEVQTLVQRGRLPGDYPAPIDDQHDGAAFRMAVDAEQAVDLDLDPRLFARFADGRRRGVLAAVHEAAGKDPGPICRLDAAL